MSYHPTTRPRPMPVGDLGELGPNLILASVFLAGILLLTGKRRAR